MKQKRERAILFGLIILAIAAIASAAVHKLIQPSTPETKFVNSLLREASIPPVKEWELAPDCGPTDIPQGGYVLFVSNVAITQTQSSHLKDSARSRNISYTTRKDGYVLTDADQKWQIIVLTENRGSENPDLFVNVKIENKPALKKLAYLCG
jgi:hypothetical protein